MDINKLVRPNIATIQAYTSARDEFNGEADIYLDANENPFGSLNRYPDPYQKELKSKLATLKSVKTDSIFVGNGSDEIIDLAFRIFCIPGRDKAITFSPTYGMYDVSAAINNVSLIKSELNSDFQIDTQKLEPLLADVTIKLIFICSPNNPTGNLINQKDIEFILQNFEGIVIIDEAYIDFAESASLIKLIDKYPNLIVSQTFSKAWGLAAARIGVAYASPDIICWYNKVKPPYNVSRLNQQAAINAINNYQSFTENKASILAERKKLRAELEQLNIVKKVYPSNANFLLIEVTEANELYQNLIQQKIIIRNRHKLVNNCLRITVGTPQENKQLIEALKKI